MFVLFDKTCRYPLDPVGSKIYADLYGPIKIDPKCGSIKIYTDLCESISINLDQ